MASASPLGLLFETAYREIRPRAPMPEFHVRFYRYSSMNNTIRLRERMIFVRISDLLEGAPESVLHAIAHILLAKLYRKEIDRQHNARYRRYVTSHEVRHKTDLIRTLRGSKRITTTKGRMYDLDEVFEALNQKFFHGLM